MQGGRDDAFTGFMSARYHALLRTAVLLTGSGRSRAEDLLQEALLRTYRAWHRIERAESAESYTRTTMVRLLLRDRRRRWHGERPTAALPEEATGGHEDRVLTTVALRQALLRLPPDQRAVLVLRFFDELTEEEIARALHCAPGTVKSRCARALAELRRTGTLATLRPEGKGTE